METSLTEIERVDSELADVISQETRRQKNNLELIASENIASKAVMAAQGSVLTNKYAEGYPNKRYYGGCECVDVAEQLAIERAKELFHAEFVNVQPHSGSQANMAVYFALLEPGDTVLGMNLSHGGHLTHGSPASFSGKLYRFIHYGVKKSTGMIDYDEVARLAESERPKLIVAGASAYPRLLDFDAFSQIAKTVNAYLMVDMAHIAGLVAAGVHSSPIPAADVVTTTTHKTLRGPRGGLILAKSKYEAQLRSVVFPGIQGGPLMHVIAAKAVAFKEALTESFKQYQVQIIKNAKALAHRLMDRGVRLISDGTDNHMILVDLTDIGITGRDAEYHLGRAGITVNKNAIPFDTQKPMITSGIRIGTPYLTSRGMKENEMEQIAELINSIIRSPNNEEIIVDAQKQVQRLCDAFPMYS